MSQITPPLAVQLYSLRQMNEPFDQVLANVAAIGYRAVETIGDHGLSADELGALLNKHELQVISTHVKLVELEEQLDEIVAFNQAIGNRTLVISSLPMALRPTNAAGWVAVGRRLNKLGARCQANGMRLLYHNHEFEMVLCDGRPAIEWMFDHADSSNLGWEPDLAWVAAGRADPLILLETFAGRCPRVHLKDLARPGESDNERGIADVGFGTLDWDRLLPLARESGAEWFIVEHDLPVDPLASIQRSYAFLQTAWNNQKPPSVHGSGQESAAAPEI